FAVAIEHSASANTISPQHPRHANPQQPLPLSQHSQDQNTNPSRKPATNKPPSASEIATASNCLGMATSRSKPTNHFEQRVGNGRAPPNSEPLSASTPPNLRHQTAASNRLTATTSNANANVHESPPCRKRHEP
ncbi:hypothetical protein V8G54_033174, partial [Vigna mungo]